MEWLQLHWNDLMVTALAVMGAFSAIARLTPTEADDRMAQKILNVIHALGLTKP